MSLDPMDQIAHHQIIHDITTVGIQGNIGSGKTELMEKLCRIIPKKIQALKSKVEISDAVKKQLEKEYEIEEITESINLDEEKNKILIFDDEEFMYNTSDNRGITSSISDSIAAIRSDYPKAILVYCYHHYRYLNQAFQDTDYTFYLSGIPDNILDKTKMLGGDFIKQYNETYLKYLQTGKYQADAGRMALFSNGIELLPTFIKFD